MILQKAGFHLENADRTYLTDFRFLSKFMLELCKEINLEPVGLPISYYYHGYGLIVFLAIKTSYLAIDTWPEYGYANLMVYSCSPFNVIILKQLIKKALKCDVALELSIQKKIANEKVSVRDAETYQVVTDHV